ncbi:unnamed protein product, partial [marine sediment metagenome]
STVSDSDTVIPVADGSQFVAYSVVTIQDEQIAICSIDTNDLNVCSGGRGFSWTNAAQHLIGVLVRMNTVSWHHNQLAAELKAIETELGINMGGVLESDDGDFNSYDEKSSPVDADLVLIEDSAASYAKKKVKIENLPGGGGEANTASNVGGGTFYWFYQKTGVDLELISFDVTAPFASSLATNKITFSITQADTDTDGYLSQTDWDTFNEKIGESDTRTLTYKTLKDFTNSIHADGLHIRIRNESGVELVKG